MYRGGHRSHSTRRWALIAVFGVVATACGADGADGPPPLASAPAVQATEVAKLRAALDVAGRPNDDRVFVAQKAGRVVAIDGEASTVVLDIADQVLSTTREEGMLGLAFHPDASLAYVTYVDLDGNFRLTEYALDDDSGAFDAPHDVLLIEHPSRFHYGGDMEFGPDGMLYISVGDGRDGPSALDVSSPLGKLLRVDVATDIRGAAHLPPDNPWFAVDGADERIWSMGLRNPWRFSIDTVTGELWIADVGENDFEEINHAAPAAGPIGGRNVSFGWPALDGPERRNGALEQVGHVTPRHLYAHEGGRCAITGGALYRGPAVPELNGWFVFGDFCTGEILALDPSGEFEDLIPLANVPAVTSISPGPGGELFATSLDGEVVRLDPAS